MIFVKSLLCLVLLICVESRKYRTSRQPSHRKWPWQYTNFRLQYDLECSLRRSFNYTLTFIEEDTFDMTDDTLGIKTGVGHDHVFTEISGEQLADTILPGEAHFEVQAQIEHDCTKSGKNTTISSQVGKCFCHFRHCRFFISSDLATGSINNAASCNQEGECFVEIDEE